jgi:hypothetical protein
LEADWRLADTQPRCGMAEMQFLGDCEEVPEMT